MHDPGGLTVLAWRRSVGFAADEDPERLGETLVLPPWLEDKREQIEAVLTPIENPRAGLSTQA